MTRKVISFVDSVILFETRRLPGFETNKFDMDNLKLLDAALKVKLYCFLIIALAFIIWPNSNPDFFQDESSNNKTFFEPRNNIYNN